MPGATTRLGLQYPLETDVESTYPGVIESALGILDDAALDLQGTLAARPSAGLAGRYYFATDTNTLYRDDGSAWVLITPGAANVAHAWTWDDQTSPNPQATWLGSFHSQPSAAEQQTLIGVWFSCMTVGTPATSFALATDHGNHGTLSLIAGLTSITPSVSQQFLSPADGPVSLSSGDRVALQLVAPGASLGCAVTVIVSHLT